MCFFCVVFAMSLCASVYMCFVVTCWEGADYLHVQADNPWYNYYLCLLLFLSTTRIIRYIFCVTQLGISLIFT